MSWLMTDTKFSIEYTQRWSQHEGGFWFHHFNVIFLQISLLNSGFEDIKCSWINYTNEKLNFVLISVPCLSFLDLLITMRQIYSIDNRYPYYSIPSSCHSSNWSLPLIATIGLTTVSFLIETLRHTLSTLSSHFPDSDYIDTRYKNQNLRYLIELISSHQHHLPCL